MQWHWAARTWEMGRDGIECTMVWFWYDYESGGWLVRVRSRKALGALYTVCDVCACPCVDRRIWILEIETMPARKVLQRETNYEKPFYTVNISSPASIIGLKTLFAPHL